MLNSKSFKTTQSKSQQKSISSPHTIYHSYHQYPSSLPSL